MEKSVKVQTLASNIITQKIGKHHCLSVHFLL